MEELFKITIALNRLALETSKGINKVKAMVKNNETKMAVNVDTQLSERCVEVTFAFNQNTISKLYEKDIETTFFEMGFKGCRNLANEVKVYKEF